MQIDNNDYLHMIGQKVRKRSNQNNRTASKPFKSGLRINTVKGIIEHPITKKPAFTFEEDDSCVECWICILNRKWYNANCD
jgi:hypothetical protein